MCSDLDAVYSSNAAVQMLSVGGVGWMKVDIGGRLVECACSRISMPAGLVLGLWLYADGDAVSLLDAPVASSWVQVRCVRLLLSNAQLEGLSE